MKKTVLQFSSLNILEDYQTVTKTSRFEIDTEKLTLTGSFNEADIELAINGFGATVNGMNMQEDLSGTN